MNIEETKGKIVKALERLPPDALDGLLEYVEFILECDKVSPSPDELEVIRNAAMGDLSEGGT